MTLISELVIVIDIEDIVVFSNNDKDIIALIYPEEELIKTKNIEEIRKIIYKEGIEINKKLESYKRVNKFYITLDVFEKTSTQKIKRTFLREINLESYISAR